MPDLQVRQPRSKAHTRGELSVLNLLRQDTQGEMRRGEAVLQKMHQGRPPM